VCDFTMKQEYFPLVNRINQVNDRWLERTQILHELNSSCEKG
jgi:hypothetical protein